jgi:hypothetical protein
MSKHNLGIIKTSILTNLNEGTSVKGFITLLKESDLLKTVLTVYDNIEKKHIPNEELAIKYIDENINLLKEKGFTKEQFHEENSKLFPLIEGVTLATIDKESLFKDIHTLIYESLQGKRATNVNKLHDAFVNILEHLKTNDKKAVVESIDLPTIPQEVALNEFFIKRAIHEFNDKYNKLLTEDESTVLKAIISENKESKQITFNTIKESTLNALSSLKIELEAKNKSKMDVSEQREVDQFTYGIEKSLTNIKLLEYNETSFEKDVLDLINLKNELCD